MGNVRQINTYVNFIAILNKKFARLTINQIANRLLIIILLIWCMVITGYLMTLNKDNTGKIELDLPLIESLEVIDINK